MLQTKRRQIRMCPNLYTEEIGRDKAQFLMAQRDWPRKPAYQKQADRAVFDSLMDAEFGHLQTHFGRPKTATCRGYGLCETLR